MANIIDFLEVKNKKQRVNPADYGLTKEESVAIGQVTRLMSVASNKSFETVKRMQLTNECFDEETFETFKTGLRLEFKYNFAHLTMHEFDTIEKIVEDVIFKVFRNELELKRQRKYPLLEKNKKDKNDEKNKDNDTLF